MASTNPLIRRIRNGTETDGLMILKQVCNQDHLKQPKSDLSVFHKSADMYHRPKKIWSHSYDKNAAFLGVMSSVELGVGEYTRVYNGTHITQSGYLTFPGYWLIDVTHSDVYPLNLVPEGVSWQYTPVVKYLLETNKWFRVLEGYYFPVSRQVLKPFYQYIKEWRERDQEKAKECYAHTFGLLAHNPGKLYPGCVYRPDWHGTIVSENNVRMHRQALQAYNSSGVYPIGWKVDCLYYDRPVSWFDERLGTGIGEWKHDTRIL